MRRVLACLVVLAACSGGGSSGDDTGGTDAPAGAGCPLPDSTADAGMLQALKAQRCNVDGSMGQRKWYRLSATLADTGDIVQLELYPNQGAFAAGAVTTGSFPVDTGFTTCGVCLRAMGDKGAATQKEYFATAGMVNITALGANGQPISATITNATFAEVNANHAAVAGGCTATIGHVQVDGTVMDMGGTGGGGGGGGGGGTGKCPTTIGD